MYPANVAKESKSLASSRHHRRSPCIPSLPLSPTHLPSHPPAIHKQYMPTNIRTGPTGKIDGRPLEVLGTPPATGRDSGRDARQPLRVVEQRRVHVRLDVAGRDGIDRDALGRPLVGEALGE